MHHLETKLRNISHVACLSLEPHTAALWVEALFSLCPRELYFLLFFFVCCLDESSSVPTAYSRALLRIWPTHIALLQGTALEETGRWTQHLFHLVTVRPNSPNPSLQPCCAGNAHAPGENKSSPRDPAALDPAAGTWAGTCRCWRVQAGTRVRWGKRAHLCRHGPTLARVPAHLRALAPHESAPYLPEMWVWGCRVTARANGKFIDGKWREAR